MQGQSDELVDEYGDQGLQVLIVIGDTGDFGENPTPDHCQALASVVSATVLYVSGGALRETYGMQINSGSALLNDQGLWLSDPDEGSAYDVLYGLF